MQRTAAWWYASVVDDRLWRDSLQEQGHKNQWHAHIGPPPTALHSAPSNMPHAA